MVKRIIIAVVAVFMLWTVLDIVIHGVLLGQTYKNTAHLWRSPEAMQAMMWLIHVATLIGALVFVTIYGCMIADKSLLTGVLYGLLFGLGVGFGMGFGTFAVMPITPRIALAWFLGTVVETVLGGLVAAAIVKPPAAPAAA